jgi:hypothetical protein
MFIYASTMELGKRLDMPVRFDTTSAFRADPFGRTLALSDLGITIPSASAIESFNVPGGDLLRRALQHRERRRPLEERHYIYQEHDVDCRKLECQKQKRWLYLDGYWQEFNFFDRNRLALMDIVQSARTRYARELERWRGVQSVGLHVRQRVGNSASGEVVFNASQVLTADYYLRALREVSRSTPLQLVQLFGDDLIFRQELASSIQGVFGISTEIIDGSSAGIDLLQMTSCGALILSASTFAWWAGYLNTTASRIVHPGVDIGGLPFWTPSHWHILAP